MWASEVILKFVFAPGSVPAGVVPIQYGSTDALAPFPLHFLTTVQSITINNNTVSMNTRDVLPALLRFNDKRSLMRYNGMCPNMYDTYGSYSDGVGAVNNPLGAYKNVGDNDLLPRGSFVVSEIYSINAGPPVVHAPQPISDGAQGYTVYVRFTSTEPLVIPPLIWANPESNSQGFYGIQNMNATFNLGDCSRVWRSSNPWLGLASTTITVDTISNSRLIFNQLTPHPSDLLPSRNVVPYATFPRYITPFQPGVGAIAQAFSLANGVYSVPSTLQGTTLSSTNIQLNQLPDKLIIFVRKALSMQNPNDADYFLPIRGIAINFNNHSGILSTATPQDLYRYSVESGSNQSWEEFSGIANIVNADPTQGSLPIPTTGSLLCLDFGKHINIVEDYYASGSLGNFQLQFNLSVVNQFPAGYPQNILNNWELVLITVNSGLFCCERGTSSSYTGILTRQDVLDVSNQEAYSGKDIERMVGGGFLDTLKSVAGKIAPKLPALAGIAKHALSLSGNKTAQGLADTIGSLGYGRSGGGGSGGRRKMDAKLLE